MPIARLRGTVEESGADWLIVDVGGIGLLALVPAPTAEGFAPGTRASLHTYLHVREDALVLYGFASREDLALFEQLISVSGVGPKAALGLLSALDYAQLTTAIASGQADLLRRVPGIGQKTAERIVLDLRDKVAPPAGEEAVPLPKRVEPDADLVAALMGLGYTQAEAGDAASRLPQNGDAPLEERIRMALALFSSA